MQEDVLKYALEHGMIDLSHVKECIEMDKRKEILKSHPYSIWNGSNGCWYTHLPCENGKRKLIKRKDKKSVEDAVIAYWKSITPNTFKERFSVWVERQSDCGRSDNTIYKYEKDYERFVKGDQIEAMDIKDITSEDICIFLNRLLQRKEVPWRALKGLFGYFNGVFEKSILDGLIENNPCKRVDLPIYRKKCVEVRAKTREERTFSKKEKEILLDKMEKGDIIEKYAIQVSFMTGMRVGEIAALQWEDINFADETITIRHSEKYNQKTKEYSIESTKTGKIRIVPMTDEMKKTFFALRDYERKRGTYGEFVFVDESGRLHAQRLSHSVYNKTRTGEFSSAKSIHAIRRTINSNMRCNGVSPTVAAAILGHSEKVNEINYTYDISSLSEKRNILKTAAENW